MTEVRVAKKDVYAEIEDEFGNKVRRLVAVEGQAVPLAFADLVKDSDTTTEQVRTRQTSARVASAERTERSHEEAREAAAATPGPEEEREERKSRRRARDKARRSSSAKDKGEKAEAD